MSRKLSDVELVFYDLELRQEKRRIEKALPYLKKRSKAFYLHKRKRQEAQLLLEEANNLRGSLEVTLGIVKIKLYDRLYED